MQAPHWRALTVLTAARLSLGVQFQSLASVAPQLLPELGLGYADLGTLIGVYLLPGIVLALPAGALGRRFGDSRVVSAGLLLMLAGGLLTCLAQGFAGLLAGRVLAGCGAVLLNVLLSKMVTDWFAGRREIVLAMAIFVNSFPIGIGLALLILSPLAAAAGWQAGMVAGALAAAAALALLRLAYRPHPNDGAGAAGAGGRLSGAEMRLVCLAGALWGIFNGAFAVTFGFAPSFLTAAGVDAREAALLTGIATWLMVASVQAGGALAQRVARPALLLAAGVLAWGGCLLLLAAGIGPAGATLLAAGLLMGLPVGVIMSLPAQALRPENRALGMGLFYVFLYLGHGGVPPLAGRLRDASGSFALPLLAMALLVLSMLPLYALFRRLLSRRIPG